MTFGPLVKRLPQSQGVYTVGAMIYPSRQVTLRSRIPTVRVHIVTDDGEMSLRARWKQRPIDLQRRISYLMREGQPIFLEDEWGRTVCLRAECVWGATVDGRTSGTRDPEVAVRFSRTGRVRTGR